MNRLSGQLTCKLRDNTSSRFTVSDIVHGNVIGKSYGVIDPYSVKSEASTALCSPEVSALGTPPESLASSTPPESLGDDAGSGFRASLGKLWSKTRRGTGTATSNASGGYNGRTFSSFSDDDDQSGAGLGFACPSGTNASMGRFGDKDAIVVSIFQSPLWSTNGLEEVLKIEVAASANVAELRRAISELYEIPEAAQRLQRTPDLGGDRLSDSLKVADAIKHTIFMLPADVDAASGNDEYDFETGSYADEQGHQAEKHRSRLQAEIEERQATLMGVAQSLQGVTYNLHIQLPSQLEPPTALDASSMPQMPQHSKTLTLDALAAAGDVISEVKAQMPDFNGMMPVLLFRGQPVPPEIPLHFAGIRDGDALSIVVVRPDDILLPHEDSMQHDSEDDDDDDDPMLRWASGR